MPFKLKLSIHEPCHENWQNMEPAEKGRYCNSCAKEVVDFTTMSDTEVLYYFINRKKENVCGRLYTDQMNRDLTKPVYVKQKIAWYWNYFVMMFLLLFKGNAGKGQIGTLQQSLEQVSKKAFAEPITCTATVGGISVIADKGFEITGKVTDERGGPVPFATIKIKGTNRGVLADEAGAYHLTVAGTNDVLIVSAVGYSSTEIRANRSVNNICVLKETVMGEVLVTGLVAPDYEYTTPVIPTYVAVIEVRDNLTSLPVKATVTIKKEDDDEEADTLHTNKKGIYKLRNIEETGSYRVTISAAGYKDSVLNIKGWNFNERKETRYVFLQKETKAIGLNDKRTVVLGGVRTDTKGPLYIVDGVVAGIDALKHIKPAEIESINLLKELPGMAIYGSPARGGVIIITTKKKVAVAAVKEDKKQLTNLNYRVTATVADHLGIAPNPVRKGSSFTLSFKAKWNGDYMLQISNAAGAVLQLQKIVVTAKENTLQVQANANWISGVYHVTVIDHKGKIVNTGSFIIE